MGIRLLLIGQDGEIKLSEYEKILKSIDYIMEISEKVEYNIFDSFFYRDGYLYLIICVKTGYQVKKEIVCLDSFLGINSLFEYVKKVIYNIV